jgi:hypothetical protein
MPASDSRSSSTGTKTVTIIPKYVPGDAWDQSGKPTIDLSARYWRLISSADIGRFRSGGNVCISKRRVLAPFVSPYFELSRVSATTVRLCVKSQTLREDGRWEDFVEAVNAANKGTSSLMLPNSPTAWTNSQRIPSNVESRYFASPASAASPSTMVNAYNRSATKAYADRWWNGRNAVYGDEGNDCANYVSQLLDAGGFTPLWGTTWWPGWTNWKNSQALRSWLYSNKFVYGVSNVNATVGDPVFYDVEADGTVGHTAMVSVDNGGWNYVTQHTTDYLTRAVVDQKNANPGMVVGFFHVQKTNY